MHWTQAIRHDPEALRTFAAEMGTELTTFDTRLNKCVEKGDLSGAATNLGRKLTIVELIGKVERTIRVSEEAA